MNYNGDICIKRQKIMFQISHMQREIIVKVDTGMTHHNLNALIHMRKIYFRCRMFRKSIKNSYGINRSYMAYQAF